MQATRALSVSEDESIPVDERVDMLVELAADLQHQPEAIDDLESALTLYERALALVPDDEPVAEGRLRARIGTVLHQLPIAGVEALEEARDAFDRAIELLAGAPPAELAEAHMNRGLVLQALAGAHRARMTDAINAYHSALRIFTRDAYPTEFAIIHNNLATAYLSIPMNDEHQKVREALAVQSFQHALEVVTLINQPSEYAMLQNNLGNALQYASSTHALQNNLRAVEAYDEALKVRTRETTPLPYANTIANKANALRNLPDDPDLLHLGNRRNLGRAADLYAEAAEVFAEHQAEDQSRYCEQTAAEIRAELAGPTPAATGPTA